MACHCGHRPQDRHWIEPRRILITIPDPDLQVQAVAVGDAEPVGEEDEVEFAALERLSDVQVEVEVEKVHVVCGITPKRVAMAYWPCNKEAAKMYRSHACGSSACKRRLPDNAGCLWGEGGPGVAPPAQRRDSWPRP